MLLSKIINSPMSGRQKTVLAAVASGSVLLASLGATMALPDTAQAAGAACTVTVNPGTEVADVINKEPAGAVICLANGTFHVNKTIAPKQGQTLRGSGASVLDGSVPVKNWVQSGSHWQASGLLPAAYSSAGVCEDDKANLCKLAENLFMDGKKLNRVGSLAAVTAGSYFADYQKNVVTVGQSPVGHAMSLAKTRTAISSRASGVVLDNISVSHFANLPQQGAVVVSGPKWNVANSVITANHSVGLMIAQGPSATITGNKITANGQLGVGQYMSNGVLIEGNTITGNNTDGFWIADWESGGIKTTYSSSTIRKNTISNNLGVGVWADVNADGVTVDGNTIHGNSADGVRYEISRNGSISNNDVTNNGLGLKRGGGTGLMSGAGIDVNTSSNVKVANNTVVGNLNGISLQARNRGTGPWGSYNLASVSVTGNKIDITSPSTATNGVIQAADRVFNTKAAGISFQNNEYAVSSLTSPKFNLGRQTVAFSAWRAAGHDTNGLAGPALAVKPAPAKPAPVVPVAPAPVAPVAPAPGSVVPAPSAKVLASDTFSRTVNGGLGTAEIGGKWTPRGSAAYYSVASGSGTLKMAAPGSLPGVSLKSVNSAATDTTTSFMLDKAPTGGGVYVSLAGRSVAGVGDYRAKVQLAPGGTYLSLVRTNASGVETRMGNELRISQLPVKAGTIVHLRLTVSGTTATTIKAKAWQGASTEPTNWLVSATDRTAALQTPGSIGILASLSGSANKAPVQLNLAEIKSLQTS